MSTRLALACALFSLGGLCHAQMLPLPSIEFLSQVEQHAPEIQRLNLEIGVSRSAIERSTQRLNPELNFGSWKGRAGNQGWSQLDFSLLLPIELGDKRASRIEVAENQFLTSQAQLMRSKAELRSKVMIVLHRARQVLFERQLVVEAQSAFNNLIKSYRGRPQLSPEQTTSLFLFQMAGRDYSLRLNEIDSEISNIAINLKQVSGFELDQIRKLLPLHVKRWPRIESQIEIHSPELEILKTQIKTSQSELKLADSEIWPTIRIGPSFTSQDQFGGSAKIWGVVAALPIPVLSQNAGGRAFARESLTFVQKSFELQSKILEIEREQLLKTYQSTVSVLTTTDIEETIHRRHEQVEAYFLKGLVSSPLVIETHRQIVDSQKSYHLREIAALESYYRLMLFNGYLADKDLL